MKKILVYDSQHAYIRFFKINLRVDYIVKSYNELDENENLDDYAAIVFLLYESLEFFDFITLYCKKIPIVFGTDKWQILEKIDSLHRINAQIISLDLRKGKHEILYELRNSLK